MRTIFSHRLLSGQAQENSWHVKLVIFGFKTFCKIHKVNMYVTGEFHYHCLTNTLSFCSKRAGSDIWRFQAKILQKRIKENHLFRCNCIFNIWNENATTTERFFLKLGVPRRRRKYLTLPPPPCQSTSPPCPRPGIDHEQLNNIWTVQEWSTTKQPWIHSTRDTFWRIENAWSKRRLKLRGPSDKLA